MHNSLPVPSFSKSQVCPKLEHLYFVQGFNSFIFSSFSLHFSQSSPPRGGCHTSQLKFTTVFFTFPIFMNFIIKADKIIIKIPTIQTIVPIGGIRQNVSKLFPIIAAQ